MSDTLDRVRQLVASGDVVVSAHAYDEFARDDILVTDVVAGVDTAAVVEDYPDYHKGPCVLVLQQDHLGLPAHVVWGASRETRRRQR